MSVSLSLKNICRRFIKDNEEFMAVNNVNLDVQPGEFLTFLGPSGCGKTTTLRMIAGFETPTSGQILVDGVERATYNDIDPTEIESLNILKDASATAIYGSMGANGVVLITTKQGTSDTPRIEFSTMVDISTPRKHIDVLDLDQFLAYSDDVGVSLDIKEGEVLEARDWQDYTMRNAVSINTRVSVSGRSDKSNYYLAGGYLDNNGIIRNTNVRQYDFRANFDHRIAKFIKVGTKTTVSNRKNQMTQGTEPGGTQNATRATSMIRQMLGSKPYVTTSGEDLGDEEDYKGTDLWLNSYEDGSDEFRLSGSLYADIRLTKWLSFKTTFGTDYRNKNRTRFYGQYLDNGLNGRAGFSELVAFRYNVDNMFNINKSFKGGHRIDAVLGISVNSAENHNSTINAQDFPDYPALEFRSDAISNAKTQVPGYSEDASTLMSYIARMVYSYKDRYVLTATFRADGSSKFSKENRFSYFPSFSAAWRMSEEKFMKNLNFISNLKLRAGWGMVGNQGLSPYQTLTTYSSMYTADPNSDYSVSPDGQFVIGIKPSIMSNRELKWETTEQYNVGLDLGLLDNRLNMTLDLYYKNTKDLLQQISIPPSTGFSSMWINRGNIENRGVEFSVDAYPVDNADFTWNVNANISFNRNKIGSIGLLKAVDKFDMSYDVKFSTSAVPMIIGEIKRYLRDDGILKVSRSLKENHYRIYQVREALTRRLEREPTTGEMAEEMGISIEELVMTMESGAEVESLHKTIYQGEGTEISLMDKLPEKENRQEKVLDRIFLEEILGTLEAKERRLIYMRYFQNMTQMEIAHELGVSQVQVSRMEKRILRSLQESAEKK